MSFEKADELWNLKMSPYHKTIEYVNGQKKMEVGILHDFPINIGGVNFSLDIVIDDTRDKFDFPIILGRSFFAQTGLILDGEQERTIIKTQEEYQVFVVT